MPQNELTPEKKNRLAALEQENAMLGSQLAACQQSHQLQTQTPVLAPVNQALQQEHAVQQCDRLLSVVAQMTKDLLEASNIDVAIPAALAVIGQAATMSRVLLHLERQDPITQKLQHCVAYEWVAAGINDHHAVGLSVMDNDHYQMLIQPLYSGQAFWCLVDDLPAVTRRQFVRLEIQSTGVIPIFIEGRYIGCVAFDDCLAPRQWSQQEIDVLTAAAESIGAALHRQQLVDRLIAERIQAEQDRAAELAKANESLRRTANRLANEPQLVVYQRNFAQFEEG